MKLGSFDPILEEDDIVTPPGSYSILEETAYVNCHLKPSSFVTKTFKDTKGGINWTDHQRGKATGTNTRYLLSLGELTAYVRESAPPFSPPLLIIWL